MGMLTNSNIHPAVTDGHFAMQICQGCMVDLKKKNPYWNSPQRCSPPSMVRSLDCFFVNMQCLDNYADV